VDVGDDVVRVLVDDQDPRPPQPRDPDGDGGRGLMIVDRLARAWGCTRLEGGKRVWAEIPVPNGR
jgi:hypothetical protein